MLLASVVLFGSCHGSDDAVNGTAMTLTPESGSSSSWAAVTAEYPVAQTPSPSDGNETTVAVLSPSAMVGKPSKFDEHVEDWQYVDDPLKNVTSVAPTGNSTVAVAPVCKICLLAAKNKPRRNKRNHDGRLLLKMATTKSTSRHRDLYIEIMAAAAAAAKQSYRRKRFHRSVDNTDADADAADEESSSVHKQLFRYKRYRRSTTTVGESPASEQQYRSKRFRRSTVAAYPNGMIRPYQRYSGNGYNGHQPSQAYPSALAADLQLQQNRRRRYRYAADPYYHRRNTAWDRSAEFRRRYLRFPPTHDAPPPGYANIISPGHGAVNPWSPSAVSAVSPGLPPPPPSQQQQPQPFSYLPQYPVQQPPSLQPQSMGPRSPRLVFRDPVDQGTLQAPFGGGANGLQDLLVSQPDDVKGKCLRVECDRVIFSHLFINGVDRET